MVEQTWDRVPIDVQSIAAPLSSAAILLVLDVVDGDAAISSVRAALGGHDDLLKTVGFWDLDGKLSCIAAGLTRPIAPSS